MSITGVSVTYNAVLKRVYYTWDAYSGATSYVIAAERIEIDSEPFVSMSADSIPSAGLSYFDLTPYYISEGTYTTRINAYNGATLLATTETTFIISASSPDTTTGGTSLSFTYLITPSCPIITSVRLEYRSVGLYDAFITFTGSTYTGGNGYTIFSYQAYNAITSSYGQQITVADGVLPAGGGTYTLQVSAPITDVFLFRIEVVNTNTETNANRIFSLLYSMVLPPPPIDRRRKYWPTHQERADAMHLCRCPSACANGCVRRFTTTEARLRAERARYVGCCCCTSSVGCGNATTAKLYAATPRVQGGLPCSTVPPVIE